jgi:hypothetical protein
VDALLARHIVLRCGAPRRKVAQWAESAFPRAKGRSSKARVNPSSIMGTLPGWICDYCHIRDVDLWDEDLSPDHCSPECVARRKYWEALFAQTQVLDWQLNSRHHRQHPGGPRPNGLEPNPPFPKLSTLRFNTRGGGSRRHGGARQKSSCLPASRDSTPSAGRSARPV